MSVAETLSSHSLCVRSAADDDLEAVQALHRRAFGGDGEATLVAKLHAADAALVSIVAVDRTGIVGHVLFSPVTVAGTPAPLMAGLAPMAVTPLRQRSGVGSRLAAEGLVRCRERGVAAVVVLGHSDYYPRFGFRPAAQLGLCCTWDVPEEAFMALELEPRSLRDTRGTVHYHPLFEGL